MSSTNPLDFYRFKGLPFDIGRHDVPRIGRDDEWAKLEQVVSVVKHARTPMLAALIGTYGAGKSYLLWQVAKSQHPAKKTGVLASGPIRLIDPEQKKDFARSLIIRFFARGIDLEEQLVPLLAGLSTDKLAPPASLRPYVELLLALTKPKVAAIARRVLTGGKALRKEAEVAGIVDAAYIKTGDDAMSLLLALQMVVRAAGVEAIAILVDEVEYADALTKQQRTAVLDSIKHIWDQDVEFFSKGAVAAQLLLVLSTTPNFWQQMKGQILSEAGRGQTGIGVTPFFARIRQSEIVEIPGELSEDEARKMIVSRMNEQRTGQKDIIPFTDDYVDYVYKLSQGLPRRILEICGVVLQGANDKRLKEINEAQAKKLLREMLISYEPPMAKE